MMTSITKLTTAVILTFSLAISSCTSTRLTQNQYLTNWHTGNFQEAEKNLKKIVTKELSQNSYTRCNNAVWYLLNLATTQFANGNITCACNTYHLALMALDYYQQPSSDDLTSQLLLEDSCSGFTPDPFEQTLARLYFALALIQNEDFNNAEAVLRETEEKKLFPNPLCQILFAHLLARRGDYSNAKILYSDISLNNNAKLIVLCHNGSVPVKISCMAPASDASLVALELFLQGSKTSFSLSSLPGIKVPRLSLYPSFYPLPLIASLDTNQKQADCFYNVAQAAKDQEIKSYPSIVARGVARYLLRRSAIYLAHKQDETLGTLLDLGALLANQATDADTRSWETLPYSIDSLSFEVKPGMHTLTITSPFYFQETLVLKENDLCIINIFCKGPFIHHIQIPNSFKMKALNYEKQI